MKRNAFTGAVSTAALGAVIVGSVALAGCSVVPSSVVPEAPASPSHPLAPASPSSPVVPVSPVSPSSPVADGATYLALVGPVNTAQFALDTAVFGSTADLTPQALHAILAASAASVHTFDDHLRSANWPKVARSDVLTLASTNDVLVEVIEDDESLLESPTTADFNSVVEDLQVADSGYAEDLGQATDAAARVRSDLGLPPASVSQATLND
jgi:hypothetical protein